MRLGSRRPWMIVGASSCLIAVLTTDRVSQRATQKSWSVRVNLEPSFPKSVRSRLKVELVSPAASEAVLRCIETQAHVPEPGAPVNDCAD